MNEEQFELLAEWIKAEAEYAATYNDEDSEGYRGGNYKEARDAKEKQERFRKSIVK